MHTFLRNLFMDKTGGEIFTVFSLWHLFYIGLTILVISVILLVMRNHADNARKHTTRTLIGIAFAVYIADFFLMPLAYGEIDIEKLPFHICTAMCTMCFLSEHVGFLGKYRTSFVLLGFLSNLVYLIYPAGVMWHGVHPLSYRVIQTLIFHSVMTAYGFLTLVFESEKFELKFWRNDLAVLVGLTLWAILGNGVYNGTSEGYDHFFNWFFVVRDPFYLLPETVAPFIMPFLNVALFFVVERILLWIIQGVKHKNVQ